MNALIFPKNPAAVARDEQRRERLAGHIAAIPATIAAHADLHAYLERYAAAAAGLNRRQRARVVWPWQRHYEPKRPPHISAGRWRRIGCAVRPQTPRGRASNPTVLK